MSSRSGGRTGRLLASLAFRHEWLAWAVLLLAVAYSLVVLGGAFPETFPTLDQEFGFRTALSREHPVRQAYETFEADFELRPRVLVYFHGPGVFGSDFLSRVDDFAIELQRHRDVYRVGSCLQLREPAAIGSQVRLKSILPPGLVEDPERLAERLSRSPFTDHWLGMLYDRDKTVFVMTVVLSEPEGEPLDDLARMQRLEVELDRFAAEVGLEYHLNGLFWINQEILRTTFENQGRLTLLSMALILALLWAMFGSLFFSLLSLFLLGISALLVFTLMAHAGMPMNGLSGNLPSMILVIGLADLIHIAARYAGNRHLRSPLGAALRAMTQTFLPNLFTTLTTFGCLIVMASTRLEILSQFATSVCLGIFLVYVVTIVYGPLVLRRAGLEPGRGLYFWLQDRLEEGLQSWAGRLYRDPRTVGFFLLFILGCLTCAWNQRINSNWFRYFSRDQPVSRSLDFLEARSFPVTGLELEIPTDRTPYELVLDEDLATGMRRLTAELEALPEVDGVFSFFTLGEQIRSGWETIELPPTLAPRWVEARRQSLFRQLVSFETHDDFYSLKTRALRLVVATRKEDSASLLDLGHRVLAICHRAELPGLDSSRIRSAGQMLYWSAIMDYVSSTFFMSLTGSLVVVFLCFLALTRSFALAWLALVPNVLPAFSMIAAAKLMGQDLSENFCLLVSLSIGIAVDDTLHFLFHVQQGRDRGETMEEAVNGALHVVGAPVVMTSLILMAGFSVCLAGTIRPTVNTGIFLNISILVALLADLLFMPAVLLRYAAGVREDGRGRGGTDGEGAFRELELPGASGLREQGWQLGEIRDPEAFVALVEGLPPGGDGARWPVLAPGFLRAYLEGPPSGVVPALLVVRDRDGEVLALSALARFQVDLDCLAPPWVQGLARGVRGLWAGFFRLDLLMFGMPAGLATQDTWIAPGLDSWKRELVREGLVESSLDLLREEGATALVWKEFTDSEREEWDPALTPALAAHPSVPSVKQDLGEVGVETLEDFRSRLRSGYRRQLERNLARGREGGLEIGLAQPFAPEVGEWEPLFQQVLARSETRLEELGRPFFEALARDPGYVLNTARIDGELVGGALCRAEGEDLVFLYVGMDYERAREVDLYFNLLHSVLALALERGCTRIHWGQTSLDAKGRFGGVARPYWFYLRFRNPLADRLVRALAPLLFPEREQRPRRVFS